MAASTPIVLASIPSPDRHEWQLGPLPIRAYALCILAGIIAALWIATKRWVARGGDPDDIIEIALWAVPFGIVGGRLYHVISTPGPYFGENGNPAAAIRIWDGGLGIWGAIALGAVGALIACRRLGIKLGPIADVLAPALLVAQAIGRLGNWFNQELFGSPTTLPWGLEISPGNIPPGYPASTLFHPTFLYEMLWNLAAAAVLIWIGRKWASKLRDWQLFSLYVVFYCLGRVWIEMLRIDYAETILGLRLNVWTSILVGAGALIAFILIGRRHPQRDDETESDPKTLVDEEIESDSVTQDDDIESHSETQLEPESAD